MKTHRECIDIFDGILRRQKQLREDILALQRECPHDDVVHDSYNDGPSNPVRTCLTCGVREIGSWWSYEPDCTHWRPEDGNPKDSILAGREGRRIRTRRQIDIDALGHDPLY